MVKPPSIRRKVGKNTDRPPALATASLMRLIFSRSPKTSLEAKPLCVQPSPTSYCTRTRGTASQFETSRRSFRPSASSSSESNRISAAIRSRLPLTRYHNSLRIVVLPDPLRPVRDVHVGMEAQRVAPFSAEIFEGEAFDHRSVGRSVVRLRRTVRDRERRRQQIDSTRRVDRG